MIIRMTSAGENAAATLIGIAGAHLQFQGHVAPNPLPAMLADKPSRDAIAIWCGLAVDQMIDEMLVEIAGSTK